MATDADLIEDVRALTASLDDLSEAIKTEKARGDRLSNIVVALVAVAVVALVAAGIGIWAGVTARSASDCTQRNADRRAQDSVNFLAQEYRKVNDQAVGFTNLRDALGHADTAGVFAGLNAVIDATDGYKDSAVILGKLKSYGVVIHRAADGTVTLDVPDHVAAPITC